MENLFPVLGALLGYLLGSVPVGLVVCRLYGVDIRQVGSGRIGGTNAWRAAGLKAAVPTILGDAAKGAVAIWIVRGLAGSLLDPAAPSTPTLQALAEALAAGAAVWGHNRPVFLGFRGGAGGITAAATAMALTRLVGGMVWLVGGLLIGWSRIASVGTFAVGSTALAATLVLALDGRIPWPYVIFGAMALVGIALALRPNRERLRQNQERIITLW